MLIFFDIPRSFAYVYTMSWRHERWKFFLEISFLSTLVLLFVSCQKHTFIINFPSFKTPSILPELWAHSPIQVFHPFHSSSFRISASSTTNIYVWNYRWMNREPWRRERQWQKFIPTIVLYLIMLTQLSHTVFWLETLTLRRVELANMRKYM